MAAPSFVFGGNTGETPESVARKRAIAALLARGGAPRTFGEGLNALGEGISARIMESRANKAEKAGRAGAGDAFSSIVAALGGGGDDSDIAPAASVDGAGGAIAGGDTAQLETYIRDAATQRGIDPDVAVRVARSEGLAPGVWQSNISRNGSREPSYGPFQLLVGGGDTGYPVGMGNDFLKATGKHPSDPSTAFQQIDFALDRAAEGGWGPWYGAAKAGVGGRTGLENARSMGIQPTQVASLDPAAGMALQAPQGGVPAVAQALAAQGGGMPPQAAAAPVQTAQAGPSMQQLLQVASNPWLSEGERSVVNALLTQQMEQQDPANQMALEKGRLELDQLRNPQLSPGDALAREKFEFEKTKAPDAPDLETLYDEATGQEYKGRWNPKTQSFDRVGGIKAQTGTSLSVNPETGAVEFQMGAGQKLTEGQSKDSVYVTRAAGSLPLIDKFGDSLTSLPQNLAGRAGVLGNYVKTPEYQQAEQAGLEFLQAILRKDTGAAITEEETASYGKTYLPQPGNSPEVLAQKKASRNRAVAAIQMGMPAAQILALEKAGVGMATMPQATPEVGGIPTDFGANDPPEKRARMWELMTPEDRALFQ